MTEREKQRLQNLQVQIAEMKSKEYAIIARETKRQRKENSRRLIQLGKIAEQHLNCTGIAPPDFEKILQQLFSVSGVGEFIEDIKKTLP